MVEQTYIHSGADWKKVKDIYVHDGTAHRRVKRAYCHDGNAWRLVHRKAYWSSTLSSQVAINCMIDHGSYLYFATNNYLCKLNGASYDILASYSGITQIVSDQIGTDLFFITNGSHVYKRQSNGTIVDLGSPFSDLTTLACQRVSGSTLLRAASRSAQEVKYWNGSTWVSEFTGWSQARFDLSGLNNHSSGTSFLMYGNEVLEMYGINNYTQFTIYSGAPALNWLTEFAFTHIIAHDIGSTYRIRIGLESTWSYVTGGDGMKCSAVFNSILGDVLIASGPNGVGIKRYDIAGNYWEEYGINAPYSTLALCVSGSKLYSCGPSGLFEYVV
jgi:hypothetical protein